MLVVSEEAVLLMDVECKASEAAIVEGDGRGMEMGR